jgi:hypothetical protein
LAFAALPDQRHRNKKSDFARLITLNERHESSRRHKWRGRS